MRQVESDPMIIRAYQSKDLSHLIRLRVALWPDCENDMHEYEVARALSGRSRGAIFLLVSTDDTPHGFVELSIRARVDGSMSEEVAYVEGWYIEPAYRGKGLGRKLIERAELWTLDMGLTELASDAELQNEQSIRAHHALGFRETFRVVQFLKKVL